MAERNPAAHVSTARLILIPSLIALAITILRLVGELQHWSPTWFDPDAGGITPTGVSWVIGITWLPLAFGVYFAHRLVAASVAPENPLKAVGLALLAVAIFAAGMFYVVPALGQDVSFQNRLLALWAASVLPAAFCRLWSLA